VLISGASKSLLVRDADGKVLMYAPITIGSSKDPLPVGDWKVTGVSWNPTFNYNPDLFWDADPTHAKAKIPPGPNNPVGVVWVDINKEHFGLHGTPEPATIGRTESHGLYPPDELGCNEVGPSGRARDQSHRFNESATPPPRGPRRSDCAVGSAVRRAAHVVGGREGAELGDGLAIRGRCRPLARASIHQSQGQSRWTTCRASRHCAPRYRANDLPRTPQCSRPTSAISAGDR
jgi:hypothetical protein